MNNDSRRWSSALPLAVLGTVVWLNGCGGEAEAATASPAGGGEAEAAATIFVDQGDLAAIRRRGELRIAVFAGGGEEFLPRSGPAAADDERLAVKFVRSLGLRPVIMAATTLDAMLPLVRDGKADLAAGRITVTESRKREVQFTRPMRVVDEVVVGRAGMANAPRRPADLAGREVCLWRGSSYAETVATLAATVAPGLTVRATNPRFDEEWIVRAVGRGEIDLTIVDSDVLAEIQTYDTSVEKLFAAVEGRQIAWAVRRDNPELEAAANAFVVEHALTADSRARFTGDLDEIRARGVLRVLTRNNAVSYFVHRGRQYGFDYELSALMADELGVRLEMVVPPLASDLVDWLEQGRGDVIAASYTVTPQRASRLAFSLPYLFVDEVVVGPRGARVLSGPAGLRELEIHVRPSSSYAATLARLAADHGPLHVVATGEAEETEETMERVASGEVPYTVADSHILQVEQTYDDRFTAVFALTHAPPGAVDTIGKPRSGGKAIAFGLRPDNPDLRSFFDRAVRKHYRGARYNTIRKRYFESRKQIAVAVENDASRGVLSPFDEMIRKYAGEYGFDWRLLAAQAYQESRFDPQVKSWVGAVGLFQVMPATGREMGFRRLDDPDVSCHAGIRYLAEMVGRFDPEIPLQQRIYFGLAAYNAGRGHVLDAMRLAEQRGLDPHQWFGNVEKAMLLLANKRIARATRYGYCRGREPVNYVAAIRTRYENYVNLVPR